MIDCSNCPLRKHDVFAAFTPTEERFMKEFKAGELKVDAGSPVLSEGAASPYLYSVLNGFGVRSKAIEDGRRQVTNFVFPGDLIGLQTAVMNAMEHSVDSTTAMTLCVFPRERLWDLLKNSPERAFDMVWAGAREESLLGENLLSVGRRTARERLAAALWNIFSRMRAIGEGDRAHAPMPWRQQDLADALGLSLVHTNKTLSRMKDEGLIQWSSSTLVVEDLDQLAAVGSIEATPERKRPLI